MREAADSDDEPISRASMIQIIRELQPKFMAASDERETGGKGYANGNGGGKGYGHGKGGKVMGMAVEAAKACRLLIKLQ